MVTLNRSAVVVKPKEPFLDLLHTADPTSRNLTLQELVREPTIYLIHECETDAEIAQAICELCEEIFNEQLAGWFNDRPTWPQNRGFEVFFRWPWFSRKNTPPSVQFRRFESRQVRVGGNTVSQPAKSKMHPPKGHYDANYGNFQAEIYAQIRAEAFSEDIGQNSWLTSDEQDMFIAWLELSPGKSLLDVACGSGGPALRVAAQTGCCILGIDAHEQAIATAKAMAADRQLTAVAEFQVMDAAERLPLPDGTFDAITCIDAINHLPDRKAVITCWNRVLKPGGRLLFTDPITVTGPLTNAEISVRGSAGLYLFVPPGYDEEVVEQCGLRLRLRRDVTVNVARVAERRHAARVARSTALRSIEGDDTYEAEQNFYFTAAQLAREGRLSRFVYVAVKRG